VMEGLDMDKPYTVRFEIAFKGYKSVRDACIKHALSERDSASGELRPSDPL